VSSSRTSGRTSLPSIKLQNTISTGNDVSVGGKKRGREGLSEIEEVTNAKIVLPKDKKKKTAKKDRKLASIIHVLHDKDDDDEKEEAEEEGDKKEGGEEEADEEEEAAAAEEEEEEEEEPKKKKSQQSKSQQSKKPKKSKKQTHIDQSSSSSSSATATSIADSLQLYSHLVPEISLLPLPISHDQLIVEPEPCMVFEFYQGLKKVHKHCLGSCATSSMLCDYFSKRITRANADIQIDIKLRDQLIKTFDMVVKQHENDILLRNKAWDNLLSFQRQYGTGGEDSIT
jgi:flagellar biosynthesis GTPase FlhF